LEENPRAGTAPRDLHLDSLFDVTGRGKIQELIHCDTAYPGNSFNVLKSVNQLPVGIFKVLIREITTSQVAIVTLLEADPDRSQQFREKRHIAF
jgi:hypothetical protein